LFQAICRTNRLDGDDKNFGHIVDYKDLFKKVEKTIAVYTSELDHSDQGADPEVLVQDRLTKGKERLDQVIEQLALLCEPVAPPKGELEHIHHFCGNVEIPTDLKEREPQRSALYQGTASLVRAYASIADELESAGYTSNDIARIQKLQTHYLNLRETIKQASGESLDVKAYEADMRHLIDTYVQADEPRKISPFDNIGLLDLIVKTGIADAIAQKLSSMKNNKRAIAETIENNVRRKIIKEHLNDPAFYEKMSVLLDEIIVARKEQAIEYEEYLKQIAELVKQVEAGHADTLPATLDSPGKRALYSNLKSDAMETIAANLMLGENTPEYVTKVDPYLAIALRIDQAVKANRPDGWRGVQAKEQIVKQAIYSVVKDVAEVERLFLIIKAQSEY
jgi:type I restriction enzyme R subunit